MINYNKDLITDELKNQYLTFQSNKQTYALPVFKVVQIIGYPPNIEKLPKTPKSQKGIITYRNQVVPIYDVNLLFGNNEIIVNEKTSVILMNYKEMICGFIVESVEDIYKVNEDEFSEMSIRSEMIENVFSVEEKVVAVVNFENINLA